MTYVAGIFGVGYGLRQIMQAQVKRGVCPTSIVISGGAGRSDAVKQMLADASGFPILSTRSAEPVLLGAAMLGAVSSGQFSELTDAMTEMSSVKDRFHPETGRCADLHLARFKAFERIQSADHALQGDLKRLTK